MERIPVTHAGSLIRPAELLSFLSAIDQGKAYDSEAYRAGLSKAVADVVARQVEVGVDIVDDGEMGKSTWITYLYERMTGLESRPIEGSVTSILPASRDRQHFPGAYAELDALDEAAARASTSLGADEPDRTGGWSDWVCTGPMTYNRAALDRDIANFKTALDAAGKDISEAFLPVVAPASAYWLRNEYYPSDEEFVFALADALHEEYRRWAQLRVDALNHALRGLPEDRIRYHICFGSWHGPHAYDPPLRDAIDLVLQVKARYYLMEQANPRHEHEWKIWEDVTLPEDKVLVPGVVTHHTNVVEHPQLVAQRLVRLANVVGRDRVMGGTDCGFAQGAFVHRVHEEIQWAKLASLAEGAKIASRELWGAKAEV